MNRILLLPGYACSSLIWRKLPYEIGGEAECTLVDWPSVITPGFNRVEDLCEWLVSSARLAEYDVICGHSMGGMAALNLAAAGKTGGAAIVLVESFITPPGPFFRNIIMPGNDSPEAREIVAMLEREKPRFSPALREELRNSDLSPLIERIAAPVFSLYGDRGCGDAGKVSENLGWGKAVRSKVSLGIIRDACHFPMVENAPEVAEALRGVIAAGRVNS